MREHDMFLKFHPNKKKQKEKKCLEFYDRRLSIADISDLFNIGLSTVCWKSLLLSITMLWKKGRSVIISLLVLDQK